MTASSHRINRLRLDVQAETPERAFSIRRQLNHDWESLLPDFERNFDTLDDGDVWVRIPRLHLRISVEHTRDFDQRLPALLRAAISEQLPELLRSGGAARRFAGPGGVGSAPGIADTELELDEHWRQQTAGPRVDRVALEQLLEYYLLHGNLPWFARGAGDWRQGFEPLVRTRFAALLDGVLTPAGAAPALRLLNLVDDAALPGLLESWCDQRMPDRRVPALLNAMLQADAGSFGSGHQRNWVVARLLRQATAPAGERAAGVAIAEAGWRIPADYRLEQSLWRGLLRQAGYDRDSPLAFDEIVLPGPGVETGAVTSESEDEPPPAREQPLSAEAGQGQSARRPERLEQPAAAVANAGLVLLHPYLARFFSACGIEIAAARPSRAAYDRAASALFFLAAGDAEAAEYELGLIKLLLGLDPDFPLPVGAGLLDAGIRQEADNLLDQFIVHWSALKSTSRDGLRAAFLQRPGLLRESDEAWLLNIEPGGVDILLERLPFSYSIVTLPWMQKPIQVEW